jgi:putative CRISPR-associated protein (TIGR02619 family)
MMTTIITTTGISLFNYARRKNNDNPPTDDQMRQQLRVNPQAASAEANSLLQIAQPNDHLVLLYTEDPTAKRCVDLLQEFFKSEGFQHIRLVNLQLHANDKQIEHELHNLVDTLVNEVDKAKTEGQEVVINATAGLKAQIVYSTMVGMLYDVPVKYMYETFKKMVTFSPVAISWDTSFFFNYEWFFYWLDEVRTQSEVEEQLKRIPEQDREQIHSMLSLPDEEGCVFLSTMVDALWRIYTNEVKEAEAAPMPPNARETNYRKKIHESILDVKHKHPTNTVAVCEKIAKQFYVEGIIGGYYENTTRTRVKGFNKEGTIWLLWSDNEKAMNLVVHTTASGPAQTRKVANEIRKILEKQ